MPDVLSLGLLKLQIKPRDFPIMVWNLLSSWFKPHTSYSHWVLGCFPLKPNPRIMLGAGGQAERSVQILRVIQAFSLNSELIQEYGCQAAFLWSLLLSFALFLNILYEENCVDFLHFIKNRDFFSWLFLLIGFFFYRSGGDCRCLCVSCSQRRRWKRRKVRVEIICAFLGLKDALSTGQTCGLWLELGYRPM